MFSQQWRCDREKLKKRVSPLAFVSDKNPAFEDSGQQLLLLLPKVKRASLLGRFLVRYQHENRYLMKETNLKLVVVLSARINHPQGGCCGSNDPSAFKILCRYVLNFTASAPQWPADYVKLLSKWSSPCRHMYTNPSTCVLIMRDSPPEISASSKFLLLL